MNKARIILWNSVSIINTLSCLYFTIKKDIVTALLMLIVVLISTNIAEVIKLQEK